MAVGRDGTPGSAGLHLAAGVPLLQPEEQVFAAMLEGWRAQQLARNLALGHGRRREAMVRAFAAHADAFPWQWGPQMLDEWLGELRGVKGLRRSTVRSYASSVSAFCRYADRSGLRMGRPVPGAVRHPPGPGGAMSGTPRCTSSRTRLTRASGRSPSMSCRPCSTTPMSRSVRVRGGGRKGWLPAFRDAALLKVAYGFGLRRTEAAMLDVADFGHQPARRRSSASYGVCQVRFGKADEGVTAQAAQRADRVAVGAARCWPSGSTRPGR